jgi:hypothetical protein
MTVFVPQEVMYKNDQGMFVPKFNMHKAEAFGKIKILLPYGNISLAPQPMVLKLRTALRNFSDDDYILPTGDPAAIGAAIAVAADFNAGKVKLLKWRGKDHKYTVLKMNLRGRHYDD